MEKEKPIKLKYLMFENDMNICWLDASISLVVHNKTFKKIVENSLESEINKILSAYNVATNILNSSAHIIEQRLSKAKEMLLAIQISALKYLKQFLKFKPGEPDSAFCALLNLIYQDKSNIMEHLNVSWIWKRQCSNCGTNSKSSTCLKPIITLAKVNSFHPESPSSLYVCSCKLEQEMELIYKEIPPCLIFHFEKGAGKGPSFPEAFCIKSRKYHLTGIVILEKGIDPDLNHFITWIRNPSFNTWLECNDLNSDIVSFSPRKPEFDLRDVYLCVYEAFDNLDKITNNEVSIDQEQDNVNINVEVIDISDEVGDSNNTDAGCKIKTTQFSKVLKNDATSGTSISMQNMKMCHSEKSKESDKPSNIRSQKASVSNFRLFNRISPNKYEIVAKSKYLDCQDKVAEFFKAKEFKAKLAHYTELKSKNSSVENKRQLDFSSPVNNKTKESGKFCAISSQEIHATEDISTNCIVQETQSSDKKATHTSIISSSIFEDNSDIRKNKVNKCDKNKLQIKMNEIPLERNENKYVNSCKEKKKKTVDKPKASSNKERKEDTDVEYVVPNVEKRFSNLNAQTASTSAETNEITKTTLRSKRTSKSKSSDCYGKRAKLIDSDNVSEKSNGQTALNKINDEKLRNIIDSVIDRLLIVFFKDIQKR